MEISGNIAKMLTAIGPPVRYELPLGDQRIPMNEHIGERVQILYEGKINCIHCGRETNKSFNQGYCFPCVRSLARCDICILKPELCHYEAGTCREPEWGDDHCMQSHVVYLSNTSGLKVGITRRSQIPTRWIDQGASQALPLFEVSSRYHSGLVEVAFKSLIRDRTDWRKMLKNDVIPMDLPQRRANLMDQLSSKINAIEAQVGKKHLQRSLSEEVTEIEYPVIQYPTKIKSFNLDNTPEIGGTLQGIKGQYLIFDTGVINVRKFGGYRITVSTP